MNKTGKDEMTPYDYERERVKGPSGRKYYVIEDPYDPHHCPPCDGESISRGQMRRLLPRRLSWNEHIRLGHLLLDIEQVIQIHIGHVYGKSSKQSRAADRAANALSTLRWVLDSAVCRETPYDDPRGNPSLIYHQPEKIKLSKPKRGNVA